MALRTASNFLGAWPISHDTEESTVGFWGLVGNENGKTRYLDNM